MLRKKLDDTVDQVLVQPSVGKAQEIMQTRSGAWLLAVVSFIESSLPIPIITDPFLIAAILLDRSRAAFYTILTIVTSILGGLVAYISALLFFDLLLNFMTDSMSAEFHELVATNESSVLLLTLFGAITPVPYTIVAWVVAALEGNIWIFLLGSVIGRTIRYSIVGFSVYKFGPLALQYARRYITVTTILLIVIAAAVVWYKM